MPLLGGIFLSTDFHLEPESIQNAQPIKHQSEVLTKAQTQEVHQMSLRENRSQTSALSVLDFWMAPAARRSRRAPKRSALKIELASLLRAPSEPLTPVIDSPLAVLCCCNSTDIEHKKGSTPSA